MKFLLCLFISLLLFSCHKSPTIDCKEIKINEKKLRSTVIAKVVLPSAGRPGSINVAMGGGIYFVLLKNESSCPDVFWIDKQMKTTSKIQIKIPGYPFDFLFVGMPFFNSCYVIFDYVRNKLVLANSALQQLAGTISLEKIKNSASIVDVNSYFDGDHLFLYKKQNALVENDYQRKLQVLVFDRKKTSFDQVFEGISCSYPFKLDAFAIFPEYLLPGKKGFFVLDRNQDIIRKFDLRGREIKKVKIRFTKRKITEMDKENIASEYQRLYNAMKSGKSIDEIRKKLRTVEWLPVYSHLCPYKNGMVAIRCLDLNPQDDAPLTADIFNEEIEYLGTISIPKFRNYWDLRMYFNSFIQYSFGDNCFYILNEENADLADDAIVLSKVVVSDYEK
jgi:hypothetical protein